MSVLDCLGWWGAVTAVVFCLDASYTFGVVGYPPEKQTWARIAFAAPLWPLIPLLLVILAVELVIGGKS